MALATGGLVQQTANRNNANAKLLIKGATFAAFSGWPLAAIKREMKRIKINKPEMNFKVWTNFTSGLLGAIIGSLIALTSYIIEEFFTGPNVKGKIMGILVTPKVDSLVLLDGIPNKYNSYHGSRFLFNLSLTSLNKDKIFSKVEAFLKFNDNNLEKGIIYFVKNDTIKNPEKFIQFINTFPKDVATQCYLNILIKNKYFDSPNAMGFQELIIDFYDFKNKCQRTILKSEDIDCKSIITKFY